MFSSLCEIYKGSKKVRETKALMLIHQYEFFKMKDDESIEEMYSRFQTLRQEVKRHKMFVNPVQCNFTNILGLPSQEENSL